jgi:hypothetical protein
MDMDGYGGIFGGDDYEELGSTGRQNMSNPW